MKNKQYITKDSGKRVKYASGFQRDDAKAAKKPRYDLIPTDMLKRLAELYTRGAEKYGDENWKLANTDIEIKRFRESGFRHFIQWMNGEDDEDHGIATIWNIMAYEHLTNRTDENSNKTNKE